MVGGGEPAPLSSISPCFFTAFAAPGFEIGFVLLATSWARLVTRARVSEGNPRPSASPPCEQNDVLTTGPGPDAGGSKPGKEGWDQMPEKSGMAAGPAAGSTVCPKAGVAAAAAKITDNPKFRRP